MTMRSSLADRAGNRDFSQVELSIDKPWAAHQGGFMLIERTLTIPMFTVAING